MLPPFPWSFIPLYWQMEKARSCRGTDDSYSVDTEFSIFEPFSCSFYVFFCFLFLLSLCLKQWLVVAEAMVVVGLNPRVPKTTCLLPSLSTETQEKASPGGPPAEASLGYLKCPHWGTAGCGSCQGLHHSPMHMLHKEFLGRYAKARRVSC